MTTPPTNASLLQYFGDDLQLWNPSTNQHLPVSDVLANKIVLLYFSASWCGPCKRFTPMLVELYNQLQTNSDHNFEVVFCSLDKTPEQFKSYTATMPWWCLNVHQHPVAMKLVSAFVEGPLGIPTLIVLDANGKLLNEDGVGQVTNDPRGRQFPWKPASVPDLLPSVYYLDGKNALPVEDLKSKYLMLYFSAHWCPPCKAFTPVLSKAYTELKKRRDDFELIFVSSDKDQESFNEYFGSMSFCAFSFQEREAKAALSSRFKIRGIPSLLMLSPEEDGERSVINSNVRGIIEHGDYLSDFPFYPKRYGDLGSTSDDINSVRCVVVFAEGGDDEEQEDIQEALQMACKNSPDDTLRYFWVCAESQISSVVRQAVKLGPITDEVKMVLLDIPDQGSYYVSDAKEITLGSIQEFVENPGQKTSIR